MSDDIEDIINKQKNEVINKKKKRLVTPRPKAKPLEPVRITSSYKKTTLMSPSNINDYDKVVKLMKELIRKGYDTRGQFLNELAKLKRRYKVQCKNSYVRKVYFDELKAERIVEHPQMDYFFRTKVGKSASGILSITVFTSPYPEYTDENGRRRKQKFTCEWNCFTEEHQLLTEKGFMFLSQVEEEYRCGNTALKFASYDVETKMIVYESANKLIINEATEQKMIEMTQDFENNGWNNENLFTNDDKSTHNFSLVATPNHNMYVRIGKLMGSTNNRRKPHWRTKSIYTGKNVKRRSVPKDFELIKASSLLKSGWKHNWNLRKFLCLAQNGTTSSPKLSTITNQLQEQLNITDSNFEFFLEFFGFWLGKGSLKRDNSRKPYSIDISLYKDADVKWLKACFEELNLLNYIYENLHDNSVSTKSAYIIFSIVEPKLVTFFFNIYAKDYDDTQISSLEYMNLNKFFPTWVWDLDKISLRCIIRGLNRSFGSRALRRKTIYTSSIKFRDELTRLCLHAGYSTRFKINNNNNNNNNNTASSSVAAILV